MLTEEVENAFLVGLDAVGGEIKITGIFDCPFYVIRIYVVSQQMRGNQSIESAFS